MAHNSQREFCIAVQRKFAHKFRNCSVLDMGSLDINGNNRYLFGENFTYVGVDVGPGPNVDIICKGHEYKPGVQYDIVISTECFEHDMFWKETMRNCVELTKSGGIFLFTCAYYNREEHGTIRTKTAEASPHTSILFNDYYKNLGEIEVNEALDLPNLFSEYECTHKASDLRFWGLKK